jgi:hypothetical protein
MTTHGRVSIAEHSFVVWFTPDRACGRRLAQTLVAVPVMRAPSERSESGAHAIVVEKTTIMRHPTDSWPDHQNQLNH